MTTLPYPGYLGWDELLLLVLIDQFFSMYNFLIGVRSISDLDMTEHMFHYTTIDRATSMVTFRRFGLGFGLGYVTDKVYYNGRTAKRELAICKPIISAIVFMTYNRGGSPFNKPITGPRPVAEVYCPSPLDETLPGGGIEWTVLTPATITAGLVTLINLAP